MYFVIKQTVMDPNLSGNSSHIKLAFLYFPYLVHDKWQMQGRISYKTQHIPGHRLPRLELVIGDVQPTTCPHWLWPTTLHVTQVHHLCSNIEVISKDINTWKTYETVINGWCSFRASCHLLWYLKMMGTASGEKRKDAWVYLNIYSRKLKLCGHL